MLSAIIGLSGPELSEAERAFFLEASPAGFILFGRNCVDRRQLSALTDELRAMSGRSNLPILIDQEGGRVARLAPPEWPSFPAPAAFGRLYRAAPISAMEAARVNAQAMGVMLAEVGINIACTPVLDLRYPDTHQVIGDRSFGSEPMQVAALGRAVLEGFEEAGVLGVVKHMPGQGRATSDSHKELPVVTASGEELESDLHPFRAVHSHAAIGMAAHILYTAWDAGRPASVSPSVIAQVIRGRIGFEGLLVSDDVAMGALSGTLAERASAVLAAGCDLVLHCSGSLAEAEALAHALGTDTEIPRLDPALARAAGKASSARSEELAARRDALFAAAGLDNNGR